MNILRPIVASSALSVLLHGVLFVAALCLFEQVIPSAVGLGDSIEISLINELDNADNKEMQVPRKQDVFQKNNYKQVVESSVSDYSQHVVISADSNHTVVVDKVERKYSPKRRVEENNKPVVTESNSEALSVESSHASMQQHSILELLHTQISSSKKYPYIARRLRREGVATIAFVLYPDGKIENVHLLNSSHTQALDRAALSAVKQIEPFYIAGDYIKKSESFQVNVEFTLY